jgi:WD40 repeat protein
LYSAALDGKVLKWNLSARTSTNLTTGDIQINSIDISSVGNYLAGVTPQGKALIWNPEKNSDRFTIASQGKAIKSVKFRPGNSLFAVGFDDGTIEMWDAATKKKVTDIKAHTGEVLDIRFNAYRPQMATSGADGTLKLWNTDDLTSVPVSFADNGGPLIAFEFSSDGMVIISAAAGEKKEIIARPAYADAFAADGCKYVTRNFTPEEWLAYVGKDIPYEKTCPGADLKIKIREIR